jgi:hypothetical protein
MALSAQNWCTILDFHDGIHEPLFSDAGMPSVTPRFASRASRCTIFVLSAYISRNSFFDFFAAFKFALPAPQHKTTKTSSNSLLCWILLNSPGLQLC